MDCFTISRLLDINKIPYRVTKIYDEKGNQYVAIWLNSGHFEFDENGMLKNIVDY